jgi:hypothetical protein
MDKISNQIEYATYTTINSRAKNCLIRYLVHFIKTDNYSKIIKPDNLKIDVYSTSDKSIINKIYYSMFIRKSTINPKFDIKKNIPIYQKMNSFIFSLKDECNNRINDNEMSIKVDLLPSLRNKMFINFEHFNFFYYNGKIFHKFIINPTNDDILKDDKEKLFIYFTNIENKVENLNLKNDLQKIVSMKDIWKVLSYIYIIIPVIDKNKAIEIYNKLPDFIKNKKDDNFKVSIIYLSDDLKDGETINIFANYYKSKNKNYFFILNKNNIVHNLYDYNSSYGLSNKKLYKYLDYLFAKNDPVQIEENNKLTKISSCIKLFNYLTNFINELSNMNYIFDFNYRMNYSIKLSDNTFLFKIDEIEKIEVGGHLKTEEYKKFKKYFNQINDEDFIFKLNEIKTVNINIDFPNEIKCKVCKEIIPNEKECYHCFVCKDFYCYKCVKNNFDTKVGIQKFIDPKHNLLFFKTRDKNKFKNIELHKLGINSFVKEITFKNHHSASCDGCSSSLPNSPRYICITCKPGLYLAEGYNDYCNKCIEHMMKNDDAGKKIQKAVQYIKTNSNFVKNHVLRQLHNHDNHVYLMVALEGSKSSYQGF